MRGVFRQEIEGESDVGTVGGRNGVIETVAEQVPRPLPKPFQISPGAKVWRQRRDDRQTLAKSGCQTIS